MTTAQDLFNNGSHAFADEDYEEALRLYTLAIEADATNAEFFLKRSTTFQKLGKDQEAYDDAVKALALTQKEQSANSSLEAKAQLRKGSAAYQLKDYRTAKAALDACHGLNPNLPTLATWIKKNDEEYSKLPVEPVQPAAPAPTPAPAPAASAPAPAPVTPAIHRVRHEWYQNDEYVTISVFIKSVKKDAVDINFTDNALSVSVKMPTGSDYSLELDPLSHNVVPSESRYEVLSTKIEIQLKKGTYGIKWGALEGEDTNAGSMASVSSSSSAYPTSSRKTKDWDALEREAAKDDDQPEGDKALNQLFAKIYGDSDDNTRRAMMKSFTESNGTCLSTNWDEVGKGTVETRPPEGMVAKKYGY